MKKLIIFREKRKSQDKENKISQSIHKKVKFEKKLDKLNDYVILIQITVGLKSLSFSLFKGVKSFTQIIKVNWVIFVC